MAETGHISSSKPQNQKQDKNTAKFTQGSIPQHVVNMSLSGSIGLLGVFLVDLLDMYFLSLLGHSELAASIGYAGTVTFFTTSICIGLAIATGVVLSKLIGAQKITEAKQEFISSTLLTLITTIIVVFTLYPFLEQILWSLGARGKTLQFATHYLEILLPALPFLGLAMSFGAALRSLGAAKAAMYSTLGGSIVNGVLDPIFIFSLELGVEGAALASAIARFSMFAIGGFVLLKQYQFFTKIHWTCLPNSVRVIALIALPALLTNFATPVGNAYIVSAMSSYGDSAVAGFSIIGRIIPVAFALVFALSGAVGPIIGQNLGANLLPRIKSSISFSYGFVAFYVTVVWLLLFLLSDLLVSLFQATGEAKDLVILFCVYTCISFLFTGMTFVSNAVFNNLGKPQFSTLMNWAKATVGTIPFVFIGSHFYGAQGILFGQAGG